MKILSCSAKYTLKTFHGQFSFRKEVVSVEEMFGQRRQLVADNTVHHLISFRAMTRSEKLC